jgi:hypothetical protein
MEGRIWITARDSSTNSFTWQEQLRAGMLSVLCTPQLPPYH